MICIAHKMFFTVCCAMLSAFPPRTGLAGTGGNNAFFAVVNVITIQGEEIKGAELSGETGSFDMGPYIQDEYTIFRNLILNTGLRYDHNITFGGTLNPRLALIYAPFDGTVRVRFEINPKAAIRIGLRISSNLLRIARIVEGK